MSTIPQFLTGKNATVFGFTPQTFAADGTVSAGTTTSLLAVFDSFEAEFSSDLVDIHGASRTMKNFVPTVKDFTARISEIIPASGTSILLTKAFAGDYFSITVQATEPGTSGAAGSLLTIVAVKERVTTQLVEGKNVATMSLRPCGIPATYA